MLFYFSIIYRKSDYEKKNWEITAWTWKIILWVFLLSILVALLPFIGIIGLAASAYFGLFQKNWKRAGAAFAAAQSCFALIGLLGNSRIASGKNKDWN